MHVLVLLNRAAGTIAGAPTDHAPDRIEAAFRAHGVDAEVRAVPGEDLGNVAREAAHQPYDAVIAGGGDGTINTVAAALSGTGKPFGVLPLGTFNHFAREVGIPLDLDAAVATLAAAVPRDLDVAEVNGRLFLNFTGIGFHPTMVRRREEAREGGRRKFAAMVLATLRVLRQLPVLRVRIVSAGRSLWRITPSVIVCTNAFQMRQFGVERVSYPERGVLNLYVARSTRWYGVAWLFVRALFSSLASAKGFEALVMPEASLYLRRKRVLVSIDGELTELATPLVHRVRHGGLRVLVPVEQVGGPGTPPGTPPGAG
ncbi:MAG: diacylglycerol kinase family protein [Pseudomonadota bacterium]|nr:diacylglycerol kinase family protein [Pseudomonadota bacterium]